MFVDNNKDKCKIFYKDKEYDLTTEFNAENIKQIEIQLNGILNITNMEEMFYKCSDLISLPDMHLINIKNVTTIEDIFGNAISDLHL